MEEGVIHHLGCECYSFTESRNSFTCSGYLFYFLLFYLFIYLFILFLLFTLFPLFYLGCFFSETAI